MNQTELIAAMVDTLRFPLYAYALAGGEAAAAPLVEILGPADWPADADHAWARYIAETERLGGFARYSRVADGLSAFLRFCIAAALGNELSPVYRAVFDGMGGLSLSLALQLFSSSFAESVAWQADFLRTASGLFGNQASLTLHPMVTRYLLGVDEPPSGRLYMPDGNLSPPLTACPVPAQIAAQLEHRSRGNAFLLCGDVGAGRGYQMKRFAESCGGSLLFFSCGDDLDAIKRYIALTGCHPCITDLPADAELACLLRDLYPQNVFLLTENADVRIPGPYVKTVLTIERPEADQRLHIWRHCLGDAAVSCDSLVLRYRFTIGQICKAAAHARALAAHGHTTIDDGILLEACHAQSAHKLEGTGARVSPSSSWDDLVLPDRQKQLLAHICDRVRYDSTVYGAWRLDAEASGVRALFAGPPGTGKTMAARVVAHTLGMALYKIDLSSLVSKYIGDTEKHLSAVFSEAAKSDCILFFDEADALFGKRGEQKDSHDKYANMQTAFLLQQFEDYKGVVLLATNLISNIDPAFMRRIHVRIDFPPPDPAARLQIWENLLHNGALPLSEDLDIPFLAHAFEITGSEIHNIVHTAAFLAAADRECVGMSELTRALVLEYAKSNKLIASRELGRYAEFIDRMTPPA